MEESGSRDPHPKIIDRQDLKSRSRILIESLITLAFWTGFLYLLVPLVTLCLWVFGVKIAYTELIGAKGVAEFVKIIKSSGIIIFFVTLIILGWTYYNYLWFRVRGERRNSRVMICYDEDFSALYHLDLQTLQKAKTQNRLVVTFTDGHLEVQPPSGPPPLIETSDPTQT
jgi:poly-beta-1,6-N-acetyl-D-glucosamine biosynthesis protein PgaD